MLQRILRRLVEVRHEETGALLLMFAYSFLAMTAYNMVQPITRSKFITAHGAENLPYVVLASIVLIALLMQGYSKLGRFIPARWIIPATQAVMVALLVMFWALYADPAATRTAPDARAVATNAIQGWVATALYWFGQIYAILLISQFWTLANLIFDPRQAKRVFGFIGAGSSLGGFVGGSLPAFFAETLGSRQLLLVSAIVLAACIAVVVTIVSRARGVDLSGLETAGEEKGVGGQEALRMLRESKHLQIIAVVIGLTSIGAGLVDQQLNMATQAFKGREQTDAMTAVLGQVQVYVSAIGFIIQMFLTTRIQRLLGVGFALMILPLGFGLMAVIILLNAALWAPMLARVMDKSLRYTVDKTSREILFLPLPDAIKHKAKPFVDVTADRFARALQGLLVLILIAPWGLGLNWQQVSYASLVVMVGWIGMVVVAKRAYTNAFRASLARQEVRSRDVTPAVADLTSIEMLVEELAHPDERRVLNAIDLLESLDKRNLVTPLLLNHPSPRVRARTLGALQSVRPDRAGQHAGAVERLLADPDGEVRAAAVAALTHIRQQHASVLVRPMLSSADRRIVLTAALALSESEIEADRRDGERALRRLASEPGPGGAETRRELAAAIRQFGGAHVHQLLAPLVGDPDAAVAGEALRSLQAVGTYDALFVPPLVALLRDRRHKAAAREILVGYGEQVIDTLAYFLRDRDEDIWVRRHIPATLARIPVQASMDALLGALGDDDGFLRYKTLAAIERLRRDRPELAVAREPIAGLALREATRALTCLSLRYNLVERAGRPADALIVRALGDKITRQTDRIFRLLGLIYSSTDITAARWALERGDARTRARALEFLDNTLTGPLRKRLLPVMDDAPMEEKVRKANVLLRTRTRDEEETLLHLINDDDAVVASLAIDHVRAFGIWTLEQDIEHVLAYRNAADWFVFEAASWALAERRMPTERVRQLWLEPLPTVMIAERLGRLPLFAEVCVDELFRLAGAGRQRRHEPGQVLGRIGVVPEGLTVLLDGRVEATDADGRSRPLVAPAIVEFEEFLQRRAAVEQVTTTTIAVVLVITGDELMTLLADNSSLIEGLFRTLLTSGPLPLEHVGPGEPFDQTAGVAADALSPIDREVILRRLPLLADLSAEEALHLAAIARPLSAEPGDVVSRPADPPAIHIVLSGGMVLEAPDRPDLAPLAVTAGDATGVYETLAGVPMHRSARVVQRTQALRIEREDLFDVMSQHPALPRHLLGALFRELSNARLTPPGPQVAAATLRT
jgi:ATP/ADP translocase/HEAT repeat protein